MLCRVRVRLTRIKSGGEHLLIAHPSTGSVMKKKEKKKHKKPTVSEKKNSKRSRRERKASISRTVNSIWKMQWQIKFSGKGWTIGVLMHVFLPYPPKNCRH